MTAGAAASGTGAPTSAEIAVIGAGVVGHSVALRLAQAGHEVVMIAPPVLGDGASYGNAGVIADYAVLPVGTPDVLRALPSLLFNRSSPLAIRRAALPTLAPWLLRFLRESLPGRAKRNAQALTPLLAASAAEWHGLAGDIGATDLLKSSGALYLYETEQDLAEAKADLAGRRAMGVELDLLGAEEVRKMEPALPEGIAAGAAFFPTTLSVADPGEVLERLSAAVRALDVPRIHERATGLRRRNGGVEIEGEGFRLRARRAVIAAGAHSRPLALAAGDRVPLDTERGYHLEFDMAEPPLQRPTCPVSRGFYFCPMDGRLRVAGTVEMGGLDAPPSPHRLAMLEDGARAILPALPPPDRSWMGLRPSVPDSVPVIGPSRAGPEIVMAFGHGHLGLTLAPITAQIVSAVIAERPPPVPVAPYLPARF